MSGGGGDIVRDTVRNMEYRSWRRRGSAAGRNECLRLSPLELKNSTEPSTITPFTAGPTIFERVENRSKIRLDQFSAVQSIVERSPVSVSAVWVVQAVTSLCSQTLFLCLLQQVAAVLVGRTRGKIQVLREYQGLFFFFNDPYFLTRQLNN